MKYYAYRPTKQGKEPLGDNKQIFDSKTDAQAVVMAVKMFGPTAVLQSIRPIKLKQ